MNTDRYYGEIRDFLSRSPDIKVNIQKYCLSEYDAPTRAQSANNLTICRKRLQLTQAEFAKRISVSLSQYKKYESGAEFIRYDKAARISLLFNMPITHLYRGTIYEKYSQIPIGYYNGYTKIWYYCSTVTDEYFEKLYRILSCFHSTDAPPPKLDSCSIPKELYQSALLENEKYIYSAIGQALQAIRAHFNLTQEVIAEAMELSLSSYQAYEKSSPRPRYHVFFPARFLIVTALPPIAGLVATDFLKVKYAQFNRLETIQNLLANIDPSLIHELRPMVEGFYTLINRRPETQLFNN